jgi:hypothetical protein
MIEQNHVSNRLHHDKIADSMRKDDEENNNLKQQQASKILEKLQLLPF